jgi:hypothetical protein
VPKLRQERLDDLALNVGESKITSLVAEGQSLVINSEKVKKRGLHIVNADRILLDFVAVVISYPVDKPTLESTSCRPD